MRLLVAEWIKVKGDLLRYPFELITAILGSLFFYLFIFNMGLGSQFGAGGDYLVYTIFVWDLTMICATIVMHNFLSQCSQGVIEQVYLAKSSFFLVLLSSCIGSTLFALLRAGVTFGLFLLIFTLMGRPIVFQNSLLELLPILLITLCGMLGLGFFLAGMTAVFKRIAGLTNLLRYLILFLVGYQVNSQSIFYIFPINGVVNRALGKVSFTQNLINSGLLALAYFIMGTTVFFITIDYVRKRGTLAHY